MMKLPLDDLIKLATTPGHSDTHHFVKWELKRRRDEALRKALKTNSYIVGGFTLGGAALGALIALCGK